MLMRKTFYLIVLMGILMPHRCVCTDPTIEDHHKLLLISFDGLKWSYYNQVKDMPGFKYLFENGVRAEYMKPAFPSQTSPCHTTIATGLHVESHGVVHNCVYDHHNNSTAQTDFYGALAVNEWWDNGYEPIWITVSSQGLKSGGYLFPGSNATIGGKTATRSILETRDTPTDENTWRERIDDVLQWFTEDKFDFIALYFEKPDTDGHRYGPNSNQVYTETLPLIDRTIQYLFEKVEQHSLTNDLNIIITSYRTYFVTANLSDHGMLDVNTSARGDDTISIMKYLDPTWITFQLSYGPLGLVEPVPDMKQEVYEALKAGSDRMTVYYKEDVPERFHYKNNKRVPSIVLLADHGYDIYRFFPGVHPNRGDHGYDNDFEDMRTSYFSIGPSFKRGITIDGFESVDIYPLMCYLLGLTPASNNGTLNTLIASVDNASGSVFYGTKLTNALSSIIGCFLVQKSFVYIWAV